MVKNSSDGLDENCVIFLAGEDEVYHESNQMQVFTFGAIICCEVLWYIVDSAKIVNMQFIMCYFALSIEIDKETT